MFSTPEEDEMGSPPPRLAAPARIAVKVDGERYVLAELSDQELLQLRLILVSATQTVKSELEKAEDRKRRTGEYANRAWYFRAKKRAEQLGRDVLCVQDELAQRRERLKGRYAKPKLRGLPRYFMETVRDLLGEEQYLELLEEAKRRRAADGYEGEQTIDFV